MKKNAMLKIAAILMVAVLLTTCAISSTFAKYTTSATGTDVARVAKFGITVSNDVNGALFAESYAKTDNTYTEGATTVQVDTAGTKLVAPGTAIAKAVNTKIEGTAEVAVRVSVVADLVLTGWTIGETEYCPIIFTINGATYGTKDTAADNKSNTIAELKTAVQNAIQAVTDDYAPNTVFTAAADENIEGEVVTGVDISWAWPFETANNANDKKDTDLGKLAVNAAPSISLTVTTTVTQID